MGIFVNSPDMPILSLLKSHLILSYFRAVDSILKAVTWSIADQAYTEFGV